MCVCFCYISVLFKSDNAWRLKWDLLLFFQKCLLPSIKLVLKPFGVLNTFMENLLKIWSKENVKPKNIWQISSVRTNGSCLNVFSSKLKFITNIDFLQWSVTEKWLVSNECWLIFKAIKLVAELLFNKVLRITISKGVKTFTIVKNCVFRTLVQWLQGSKVFRNALQIYLCLQEFSPCLPKHSQRS